MHLNKNIFQQGEGLFIVSRKRSYNYLFLGILSGIVYYSYNEYFIPINRYLLLFISIEVCQAVLTTFTVQPNDIDPYIGVYRVATPCV